MAENAAKLHIWDLNCWIAPAAVAAKYSLFHQHFFGGTAGVHLNQKLLRLGMES